jgi:hypothetical protein
MFLRNIALKALFFFVWYKHFNNNLYFFAIKKWTIEEKNIEPVINISVLVSIKLNKINVYSIFWFWIQTMKLTTDCWKHPSTKTRKKNCIRNFFEIEMEIYLKQEKWWTWKDKSWTVMLLVSILHICTICLLNFGTVPTAWYF